MACIVNEQGRVLPKVRQGILVRRLCGAALEMCFLVLVQSFDVPERYRFKDDADVWRWRDDVDILENMWTLAKRVKELLNVCGWTLQYAQRRVDLCDRRRVTKSLKTKHTRNHLSAWI